MFGATLKATNRSFQLYEGMLFCLSIYIGKPRDANR